MNLISGSVRGTTTFYDGNRLFVGAADFSLEKVRLTVQGLYLDSQKLPVVPLNVHTERGATKFLASCIRYERIALVLMHFLMGCTSRATDYQHFKVSDFESINSELLLLHRTCQKNTLLKGVKQRSPVVLPKKFFRYVKKYYDLVRPRCVQAAKRLGKPEPILKGKCGTKKIIIFGIMPLILICCRMEGMLFYKDAPAKGAISRRNCVSGKTWKQCELSKA